MKGISPLNSRGRDLANRRTPRPHSVTQRLLDARNLLKGRSPLARLGTAEVGKSLYLYEAPGRLRDYAPVQGEAQTSGSLQSVRSRLRGETGFEAHLNKRLEAKAAEYFEMGIAYYRNRDLLNAAACFDLVKDIRQDEARPYLAGMIIDFERQDFHQAFWDLDQAFHRFHTLDDLRFDRFVERFFESRQTFDRMLDVINVFAQRNASSPHPNLILAYFSWLDGDSSTAIAATEAAMQSLTGTPAEDIRRFRDLLIEERAAAAAAGSQGGGPTDRPMKRAVQ